MVSVADEPECIVSGNAINRMCCFRRGDEPVPEPERGRDHQRDEARRLHHYFALLPRVPERRFPQDPHRGVAQGRVAVSSVYCVYC